MLAQLPIELLEHVLHYSGEGDKMNIACCNRQHSELMKPLLWQRMRIMMEKDLISPQLHPAIIEHARYARELTFVSESGFAFPWKYNVKVSSLLDALDVKKVTILKIKHFVFELEQTGPCSAILRMLLLPSLKKLELISSNECYDLEEDCDNWNISHVPKTLTQLSICKSEFSVQFFRTLLDGNPSLSTLIVDQYETFSNDSLIEIGKSRNLTSLSLSQLGDDNSSYDITPLGCLQKLETLELQEIIIEPGALLELWEGLTNLVKLQLINVNISDQGFLNIYALRILAELVVLRCSAITGNCFVTSVSSLEKVKFLKFDVELFEDVIIGDDQEERGEERLSMVVARLNKMPSLNQVTIDGETHDHSTTLLRAFCGKVKKWILTFDDNGFYVLNNHGL